MNNMDNIETINPIDKPSPNWNSFIPLVYHTDVTDKMSLFLDMFPRVSLEYISYVGSSCSNFFSNFFLAKPIFSKFSYSKNIGIFEFRSSGFFPPFHSSLFIGIKHIFSFCPKPKMTWVNARRVVAGMTETKIVWWFSEFKFPRYPMRSFLTLSSSTNNSVTTPIFRSRPNPARICFFNTSPKSNFKSFIVKFLTPLFHFYSSYMATIIPSS